jgi:hypothetical protein
MGYETCKRAVLAVYNVLILHATKVCRRYEKKSLLTYTWIHAVDLEMAISTRHKNRVQSLDCADP